MGGDKRGKANKKAGTKQAAGMGGEKNLEGQSLPLIISRGILRRDSS